MKFTELLQQTWQVMLTLSPWLLIGLVAAGMLYVIVPSDLVARHLGGKRWSSVFKAVFFGVPMPLCSCGVIPAAIGIHKQGASKGASVAFLISTPQTGIDSIFVASGFLGWPFALFKVATAFVTGIVGGLLVNQFEDEEEPKPISQTSSHLPGQSRLAVMYDFAVNDLLQSIWAWLAVGVIVSGAISTYVDPTYIQESTWLKSGVLVMAGMLLISLPMYVCATSSVPIAAALVHAGFPPGAALVFLMAGPASNVATMGAIYRTFGGKILAIYLSTIAVFSIAFGYLFSFVLELGQTVPTAHHEHTSWWAVGSAVIILFYFALFTWKSLARRFPRGSAGAQEETLNLNVGGMTCGGCAGKVKDCLLKIDGVGTVTVDLETGNVEVSGSGLDRADMAERVTKLGFAVN